MGPTSPAADEIDQIAIVGGGIIGTCIAYFLATADIEAGITVYERDDSYMSSSTVRSAAAVRQQFNLAGNVEMSRFGWDFFARLPAILRLDRAFDLKLTQCPYLMLAASDGRDRLIAAMERQASLGVDVELVDGDQLGHRFPWLNTDDLAAATIGPPQEGWFDPAVALRMIREKAEALAVRYVSAEVTGFELDGGYITRVELDHQVTEPCDVVIDAAGPRAADVARLAGVEIPVQSRKRTAFVFSAPRLRQLPVQLVDPTVEGRGLYMRPYNEGFLAVTAPAPARDPHTFDLTPDEYLFEEIVRPALEHRVPGFRGMQLVDAWGGHYELNTLDQNVIVGRHSEITNLLLACGSSGHGVMHAPALGRGIAELVTLGAYASIDLSPFGFERVSSGSPLDDIQPSEQRRFRSGI